MSKTFNFIIALAFVLIASACKKTPEAIFIADSGRFYTGMGDTVKLYNYSTNAKSYDWDFGDGSKSTDDNPIHIYTEKGDYTITLTVHSSDSHDGKSASVTQNISVSQTFSKATVNSLMIIYFPGTEPQNLAPWDGGGGPFSTELYPDVYFAFKAHDGATFIEENSSNRVNNYDPNSPAQSLNFDTPLVVDFNKTYDFELRDYDPTPDLNAGMGVFDKLSTVPCVLDLKPYRNNRVYDDTIRATDGLGKVTMAFIVNWSN